MSDVLSDILDNTMLFDAQTYENMTVIGLTIPNNNKLDLMSLETGLDLGLVEITETSESGVVGKVRIINNAVNPLLILDGEEIIGSKQNRIVNATVIIDAKSEKVVPVSCTEAGRWEYKTPKFNYSEYMATSRVRRDKQVSVNESLNNNNEYASNQSQVWENIGRTNRLLNTKTSTGALHDSYDNKSNEIKKYKEAFKINENQNGVIVYINGKLSGLEILYNNHRYSEYHDKLLESYIIDALILRNEEKVENENPEVFINEIKNSKRRVYNSIGLGKDYRINKEDLTGSAVVYDNTIINASFFNRIEE